MGHLSSYNGPVMKILCTSAVLFSLVVSASAMSLRDHATAMDAALTKVMLKKDMDGFEKYLKPRVTSDFKYTELGKVYTFKAMVDEMRSGMKMMGKVTKVSTKPTSIKEAGDTGTVVANHMMEWTSVGADKKTHKFGFTGSAISNYRKVKGKWLLASMDMTTNSMTMDGKPMPMPSAPPQK
jgi:hypothetical protein